MPQERRTRAATARLRCGRVLVYEHAGFLPSADEVVPCRDHGYCAVDEVDGWGRRGGRAASRRPGRDSYADLMAFLDARSSSASIESLRRHRFPAGLLARAQRDGVVRVDWLEGYVDTAAAAAAGRPPGRSRSASGA